MIYLISVLFALNAHAQIQPVHDILDSAALDRGADPCQNFYQFTCGTWLKNYKLPADKSRYWRQGGILSDNVEEQLNTLLISLSELKKPSHVEKKLGDFYRTCREAEKTENSGLSELQKRLSRLDEVKDKATAARAYADLELLGIGVFYSFYGEQDPKDSNRVIGYLDRAGMTLPDPDYYLNDDTKSKEIREAYKKHIAKIWVLAGGTAEKGASVADFVLAFETDMARHSLKKDDLRDMAKTFHPMTFSQVKALVPAVDFDGFFRHLKIPAPAKFNVTEPEFMKNMTSKLEALPTAQVIDYMKVQLILSHAAYITGPLEKESFNFWKSYLLGQKEMPPRWKYCVRIVAGAMDEALGRAYVDSIPGAKAIREKTVTMFQQIKAEFREGLKKISWMDQPTREQARKKLDKMKGKIGWPAKWLDYSKVKINPDDFLINVINAGEFEVRRRLAKIGKPMDRSEWEMAAWEPNAYYTSGNNEMVLPLGETVPPVYDPKFSDGANYAALGGSTIGHELIHGFDDSGKDMNADGNYVTWWTAKSQAGYEKQSACYIQQTEAYDILPGEKLRIRGKATLGENLADNGGVKLGLRALEKLMKKRKPAPAWEGFNEMQQYFIAYGQGWCMKTTEQQLRDQLLTDYHPPAEFRVNAVLMNQPEFAEAFNCAPGARMNPKLRCSLW